MTNNLQSIVDRSSLKRLFKLNLRHKLIFSFLILIFAASTALLVLSPKMLTENMEKGISQRLYVTLNTTDIAFENAQKTILFFQGFHYISEVWKSLQHDLSSTSNNAAKLNHFKIFLNTFKNFYDFCPVEIIPAKGILPKGQTIKAPNVKTKFIDEKFVLQIQKMIALKTYETADSLAIFLRQENEKVIFLILLPLFNRDKECIGVALIRHSVGGVFLGFLRSTINYDIYLTLYSIDIKSKSAPFNWTTVADANGENAIRPSLPPKKVKSILKFDQMGKTYFGSTTIDGSPYRIGYKILRNEKGPVGLIEVAVPTESIVKTTAAQKKQIYMLTAFGILLAFLLMWWISRSINIPLKNLVVATEKVSQGNYEQKIKIISDDELGFLADKFNWMVENIKNQQAELVKKERLAAIGNFTSTIIHDFKNPLATILWYTEFLKRENISAEQRDTSARFILEEINRLEKMTYEILDYVSGTAKLNRRPCNLNKLMTELYTALQGYLKDSKIEIILEQGFSGVLDIDIDKINRAIYNLASNAKDAMPSGGTLTIKTLKQDNYVLITVSDTGKGILPEVLPQLFEPFFTQGKKAGSGLGLSICQKIIEQHNGTIKVESTLDKGTTFSILLPLECTNEASIA